MNDKEAKEIALRLKDCAADMEGILRLHKLTRENAKTEAMTALGTLMIARWIEVARMQMEIVSMFAPVDAVDSIYEQSVYELHRQAIHLANEYEHEQADSCPEWLNEICKVLWEAARVYRPEAAPKEEEK